MCRNDWSISNLPLFQEEIVVLLAVEETYIQGILTQSGLLTKSNSQVTFEINHNSSSSLLTVSYCSADKTQNNYSADLLSYQTKTPVRYLPS